MTISILWTWILQVSLYYDAVTTHPSPNTHIHALCQERFWDHLRERDWYAHKKRNLNKLIMRIWKSICLCIWKRGNSTLTKQKCVVWEDIQILISMEKNYSEEQRKAWHYLSHDVFQESKIVESVWLVDVELLAPLTWVLVVEGPTPYSWLFTLLCGPRRRQWHPTPVLLPGKSHGRRSLVGCSPWGLEESDMAERLHFHFSLLCIGEGNGNPLQHSCLQNPRDGVAQSRTRLKWLGSSSGPKGIFVIIFPTCVCQFLPTHLLPWQPGSCFSGKR